MCHSIVPMYVLETVVSTLVLIILKSYTYMAVLKHAAVIL